MSDTYTFRALEEKDIPLILRFRDLLFQEDNVPEDAFISDKDEVLFSLYTENYRKGESLHFAAFDSNGNPVAVAGALLKRDFPYFLFEPGYYGWIIDVYTEPDHRRRKLASRLLKFTQEWLLTKGVQEIKLIAAGAAAQQLYKGHGYRSTWEMSKNVSGKPTYNELLDRVISGS